MTTETGVVVLVRSRESLRFVPRALFVGITFDTSGIKIEKARPKQTDVIVRL